ncbi:MAG TPA: hypothetical protein PKC24_02300 [Cyclobacteriaceae bacterium]|nr:hypothetical protein [Cyclobacteriaceae bacterium]
MHNSSLEREKEKVLHDAELHREEMEAELSVLSEKAERAITTALIVGGSLALTYFIAKGLFGSTKKKQKVKKKHKAKPVTEEEYQEEEEGPSYASEILSRVGDTLVSHASAILLELAKEKLIAFLQSQQNEKDASNSSNTNR